MGLLSHVPAEIDHCVSDGLDDQVTLSAVAPQPVPLLQPVLEEVLTSSPP
jgi:hypothetical protein